MYKVTGIPLKSTAVFLFNSIYPDSHSHPPAFLIFVWLLISVPLPHIWAREDSFIYSVLKHLLKKKKKHLLSSYYMLAGASLIAHLVKNLPAIQETLVQFQSQEDLLEKG